MVLVRTGSKYFYLCQMDSLRALFRLSLLMLEQYDS